MKPDLYRRPVASLAVLADEERLEYKLSLTKALYRRGWTKQQILYLYRFIDWVMRLSDDMEDAYHKELFRYEEEIRMPYVTTAERIGIKKGKAEGRAEGKAEEKIETAINLFSIETITDEQIAQVTKLDIAEVRRLRQEYAPESGKKSEKSPFDVPGIRTEATTEDILAAVRKSRERSGVQDSDTKKKAEP